MGEMEEEEGLCRFLIHCSGQRQLNFFKMMKPLFRTMTRVFKKLMKPLFKTTFAKLSPTWPKIIRLGNSFKYKLFL